MATNGIVNPSITAGLAGSVLGGPLWGLLGGAFGGNIGMFNKADNSIRKGGGQLWEWYKRPSAEMAKAEGLAKNQLDELNAFYNENYYKDYMNSAEAQSAMRALTEQVRRMMGGVDNQAVASGATDESKLAAKTGAVSTMADAINRLASLATQRKDSIRKDYMNYSGLLNQQMAQIYGNKAQGYLTQQNNIFQGLGDLFGAATAVGGAML